MIALSPANHNDYLRTDCGRVSFQVCVLLDCLSSLCQLKSARGYDNNYHDLLSCWPVILHVIYNNTAVSVYVGLIVQLYVIVQLYPSVTVQLYVTVPAGLCHNTASM